MKKLIVLCLVQNIIVSMGDVPPSQQKMILIHDFSQFLAEEHTKTIQHTINHLCWKIPPMIARLRDLQHQLTRLLEELSLENVTILNTDEYESLFNKILAFVATSMRHRAEGHHDAAMLPLLKQYHERLSVLERCWSADIAKLTTLADRVFSESRCALL